MSQCLLAQASRMWLSSLLTVSSHCPTGSRGQSPLKAVAPGPNQPTPVLGWPEHLVPCASLPWLLYLCSSNPQRPGFSFLDGGPCVHVHSRGIFIQTVVRASAVVINKKLSCKWPVPRSWNTDPEETGIVLAVRCVLTFIAFSTCQGLREHGRSRPMRGSCLPACIFRSETEPLSSGDTVDKTGKDTVR